MNGRTGPSYPHISFIPHTHNRHIRYHAHADDDPDAATILQSIDYFILQSELGLRHCGAEIFLDPAPSNGTPLAFSCGEPSIGGEFTHTENLCCSR